MRFCVSPANAAFHVVAILRGRLRSNERPHPSFDRPCTLPVAALVRALRPLGCVRHAPGAHRKLHVGGAVHEMPLRAVRVVLGARRDGQGGKNRSSTDHPHCQSSVSAPGKGLCPRRAYHRAFLCPLLDSPMTFDRKLCRGSAFARSG